MCKRLEAGVKFAALYFGKRTYFLQFIQQPAGKHGNGGMKLVQHIFLN